MNTKYIIHPNFKNINFYQILKFKKPVLGVRYSKPNKTSVWLQEHLKGGTNSKLWKVLEQSLKYKCGMSMRVSQIEDHIQAFFEKLVRRDSLKEKIENNLPIYYKQLAVYAVNSAKNDMRDNGSNPVCRELHGARTDTEMKGGKASSFHASGMISAVKRKDEDDKVFMELVDDTSSQMMESYIDYPDFMKELFNKIHPYFRKDTPKVLKALELLADGESKQDIMDETGIADIPKMLDCIRSLVPRDSFAF
jgi:hypothetical protein